MKKLFIKPGRKLWINGGILLALLGVYIYSVSTEGFSWPYFWQCLGLLLAIGITMNLNIRLRKAAGIIVMLLLPPASFYLLEAYSHSAFEMGLSLQILNILFFYLLFGLIFFLSGKGKTACIAGCFIPMVVGIANYYTVCFRGSPILPWDLLSLGTAMSVTDNYEFAVEYPMLVVALAFILLIVIGAKADIRLPEVHIHVKEKLHSKKQIRQAAVPMLVRTGGSIACIAAGFAVFWCLQVGSVKSFLGLDETLFLPNSLYATNGFAVSFLYNLQYIEIDKPEGYSVDQVADIMEPYMEEASENAANALKEENKKNIVGSGNRDGAGETDADGGTADNRETAAGTLAEDPETSDDTMPNIIVIMNEAFSDLSVLGDFPVSEDYMPFWNSLTEDTVRGNLFVSVKGGNTANTEFEFLTGDTMAFLPQGSIAYQQYIHEEKPTLVSWLEGLGYSTAALHPFNASGWDRDEVYPYFGFDDILFYPDFTYRELLRTYVSDESSFNQLIDLYENRDEEKPFFAFEVTMQNHGGYYNDYENFTPDISLGFEPEDSNEKHYTEQYLSLVKKSDEAFEMLIEYFAQQDEKTIVVMFGDHQPTDIIAEPILEYCGIQDDDSLEAQQQRYITPFIIWANYDIEEQEIQQLSANYLGALIMDVAGLPKTAYQEFLTDLSQKLPVITANVYIDAQGNYYNSADNPYAEELEEYRSLQYYHLFEDDKSLVDFYGIMPDAPEES